MPGEGGVLYLCTSCAIALAGLASLKAGGLHGTRRLRCLSARLPLLVQKRMAILEKDGGASRDLV